jgi:hypothetical protein
MPSASGLVLKLMYATVIRAAHQWRRITSVSSSSGNLA